MVAVVAVKSIVFKNRLKLSKLSEFFRLRFGGFPPTLRAK